MGSDGTGILTKAPFVGAMAKVEVSQSDDMHLYYHPKGPSSRYVDQQGLFQNGTSETYGGGGQPPSFEDMMKNAASQTHPRYVNQQRFFQNGTSETYGGGQPPSFDAMLKNAASQTHPRYVNQQRFIQNGTSETYHCPIL
uniref:uncharacterized protein LOC122589382 n=1 Tax=Erigeron canadensis TaxID=72917 RepID=UPI001CB96048|nr:uncharacterized protein LOC122589382 [Erigeron canadensis]